MIFCNRFWKEDENMREAKVNVRNINGICSEFWKQDENMRETKANVRNKNDILQRILERRWKYDRS